MSITPAARPWNSRTQMPWSLPASLQPRVPRRVQLIEAATGRAVRETVCGYPVRWNRRYRIALGKTAEETGLGEIAAVSGPLRLRAQNEAHVDGAEAAGSSSRNLEWEVSPRGGGRRWGDRWWSRLERQVFRMAYEDGREDGELAIWLLVRPQRNGVLITLVLAALICAGLTWLLPMAAERLGGSASWSPLARGLFEPNPWWAGCLVSLLAASGLVWGDRLQLALQCRARRSAIRAGILTDLSRLRED